MSITEKELDHLATLCKLKLNPEEKEKFLWNMDSIKKAGIISEVIFFAILLSYSIIPSL